MNLIYLIDYWEGSSLLQICLKGCILVTKMCSVSTNRSQNIDMWAITHDLAASRPNDWFECISGQILSTKSFAKPLERNYCPVICSTNIWARWMCSGKWLYKIDREMSGRMSGGVERIFLLLPCHHWLQNLSLTSLCFCWIARHTNNVQYEHLKLKMWVVYNIG